MTRNNNAQVAMTGAEQISPTQLEGDTITVPGISTAGWPPGRYKVNSICIVCHCGVWLLLTFYHLVIDSAAVLRAL